MALNTRIGSGASQDRLERLIEERLKPNADKNAVDARIWSLFGENWAVMFTDLAGFSRRVAEFGIIHFLQTIYESQRILIPVIEEHSGILLKIEGDSMLVIFRNVDEAISCAVHMQQCCADYNGGRQDAEKVLLCIGLGYGQLLRIGDADVYGAEVNAAAKLGEDAARANEVLVTGAVREAAKHQSTFRFEPIDAVPAGATAAFRMHYPMA